MVEYRILQDGLTVAGSNSLTEAMRYVAVYGQDGPAILQKRTKGKSWSRWRTIANVYP